MTSIQAGISIFDPRVKEIDTSTLPRFNLAEADEALYQQFIDSEERFLTSRYTLIPDTSKDPAYQNYATVEVDGEVVARIDNHGYVSSTNAAAGRFSGEIPNDVNGQNGPILAEVRAAKIAELLGGEVIKSSTALTQAQFKKAPELQLSVDYKAMMADPAYQQLQKTKEARTLFLAQQMAQSSPAANDQSSPIDTAEMSPVDEYLDFMSKTPEQRYFEFLLAEEGLTKEEFDALPPEEKLKVENKIQQKMKEQAELLTHEVTAPPEGAILLSGDEMLGVVSDERSGVVLNTSHGQTKINVEDYFTPRPESDEPIDLMSLPLLLPSKHNIDTLSKHASEKLKGLMAEYDIPYAPEQISYDDSGQMLLPYDYEHADKFNQMIEENDVMSRELSTINALTSHYVEMQKVIPFHEEFAEAKSKAEADLIIAKYSHLLTDEKDYSRIALVLSSDGDVTPMADLNEYSSSS